MLTFYYAGEMLRECYKNVIILCNYYAVIFTLVTFSLVGNITCRHVSILLNFRLSLTKDITLRMFKIHGVMSFVVSIAFS